MTKRILVLLIVLAGVCGYKWVKPSLSSSPRIYDCFLFFNEFELLQVRLKEMAPHVDYFVLVEASETFRGQPKALHFQENQSLFEEFKDKIIYVPITEHFETESAWERERFQRAQVMRGLKECKGHDIVLLSDLDEIVRGSAIEKIPSLLKSNQAVVCDQKMYYGYLNRYWMQWPGTVATTYAQAKKLGIKKMRKLRNQKPRTLRKMGIKKLSLLPDAGWHFTSMGGTERCVQKVEAYSHSEFDHPEAKTTEYFQSRIQEMAWVPVDSDFPCYVQENLPYFESIGFVESRPNRLP